MPRMKWLALFAIVVGPGALLLSCSSGDSSNAGGGGGTPAAIEGPATWSAIYADYFAPSGAASCGGDNAGCHSTKDDPGAVVSNLLCSSADECFTTTVGLSGLVKPDDVSAPGNAKLFRFLRTPSGNGKMPKGSDFEFQDGDISRIEEWISNGAKND
jgi:hypothetical protein